MADHTSCPTAIIEAPIDCVWGLLTDPEGWGTFYDLRVVRVEPPGRAAVGQIVHATTRPLLVTLGLQFRFTAIDPVAHRLCLDVRLPLGVLVQEDMRCVPMGPDRCRVAYDCGFTFPPGWRGLWARAITRPGIESGPADSLARLKRAAEARSRTA